MVPFRVSRFITSNEFEWLYARSFVPGLASSVFFIGSHSHTNPDLKMNKQNKPYMFDE